MARRKHRDPKGLAWTYLNIAKEYRGFGDHEKSFACLARSEQLDPNNIYLYEDRASIYNSQGLYAKALADANKGIELAPQRPWMRKRRAEALFYLSRFDEALADIAKAVELNPQDLSNLLWISLDHVARCPDESFRVGLLALADEAVELNNHAAQAYAVRGRILAAFGQDEHALADVKTALDNLPEEESGDFGLSSTLGEVSIVCIELSCREEAVSFLVQMTELQPKQPILWYRRALGQLAGSQKDAYDATCRAMVQQFQEDASPDHGYWTVWTCALAPDVVEDYSPVVGMAEQGVAAEPASELYIKTLGGILYRAGRCEEAVQQLTKADALIEDPDSQSMSSPAYTWYLLAMAHHKLGHDTEAQQWLDKANSWTDKVLAEHEAGTNSLPWNRRLTLKLLRTEAEGMIEKDEK